MVPEPHISITLLSRHEKKTTEKQRKGKIMAGEQFFIRSKIWIEDTRGNVVFGFGRYRMLEAVDRHCSLQAAAKELKMSYRALWGRIKASEERLGKSLVQREGRGSKLTPYAVQLMERFQTLQKKVLQESDQFFADLMVASLE